MTDPKFTKPPSNPTIWLISTGTEIMQGHYADTNAQWLSRRLLELGYTVSRHMAAPDIDGALHDVLAEAAGRADFIVTTGGLGPTADDRNREAIAEVWGTDLVEDAEAITRLKERFRHRGRTMTENNRVQALIPRGADVLHNDHGTAPGFYLRPGGEGSPGHPVPRATLCALPGPPRELQPMFNEQAVPLIEQQWGGERTRHRNHTFNTVGIPESLVDQCLADLFDSDEKVILALLHKLGRVMVRLTLVGCDEAENEANLDRWRGLIKERLGPHSVFGENDELLEMVVGRLLTERGAMVATAESCTGGLIAGRLTDIPGSSSYFTEGFVTYANAAKIARLGVDASLIERHGVVSAEVAGAMALGARAAAGTDWALSVTGIAGPDGGSESKPVGLVYVGIAMPDGHVETRKFTFLGNRAVVREQTCLMALETLRRAVLGVPLDIILPGHDDTEGGAP